jgi:hypothetical protein
VLDRADDELQRWAAGVLPDATVTLGPPLDSAGDPTVRLHLLDLVDIPAARGAGPAGLQVAARYLVTTAAEDPQTAHRLLGALLFAAMERPELEVSFAGIPPELWAACGTAPRAAFLLSTPVRVERPERRVPWVRKPLAVQGSPLRPLAGVVLGPGDVPIIDAFIRIPALRATTRSDARGRFRFPAVPSGLPTELLVRAKASEFPFTIASPPDAEPVVLRLALSEG